MLIFGGRLTCHTIIKSDDGLAKYPKGGLSRLENLPKVVHIMKLGFAFLANYADLQADGRFSVSGGGIDGYVLDNLPTTIQTVALVACVVFEPQECGESYTVKLTYQVPRGVEQAMLMQPTLTPKLDAYFPERNENLYIVIPMSNWIITMVGFYNFHFYVNDVKLGSVEVGVAVKSASP